MDHASYLSEKVDEIKLKIQSLNWVNSYELFLQNMETLKLKRFDKEITKDEERTRAGAAIRILSDNRKLLEFNFSLSTLPEISEFPRPKSTMKSYGNVQFKQLDRPRISGIPGDKSKTTRLDRSTKQNLLENLNSSQNEFEIPFFDDIVIEKEHRVIANSFSETIFSSALRVNYSISTKFKLNNVEYSLSRSIANRSIEINFEDLTRDLVMAVETRLNLSKSEINDQTPVILHPNIFGKLVAYYFSTRLSYNLFSNIGKWKPNLLIYDDPHRDYGLNSCLFDDEGSLTKSKVLFSEGVLDEKLEDKQSTNWNGGGNGYRVDYFQPMTRSFQYSVKPTFSNLVLIGGTGKGEFFTQRSHRVLLVREGECYLRAGFGQSNFILHASETEVWENGNLIGPGDNTTILGNLDEIFRLGHLSSDEIEVTDSNVPGSVYTGWMAIGPNAITVR